jgi:ParB-like chromosome segregation protein Spo0J
VAEADGSFEVVNGFKRLARWQEAGHALAPVVIESPRTLPETKLLLLRLNTPARTATPMDEARVIRSLVEDDGLSLAAVAQLLNKRKPWVARRLALALRLSPAVQNKIEQRTIGPALGYAFCALSGAGQEAVLRSVERHSLREREALALISAWRVASSDRERAALLADPIPAVRPQAQSSSPLSALATNLHERLETMRQALSDLSSFQIPEQGLSDAERRRLEAEYRFVLNLLSETSQTLGRATTQPSPDKKENSYEQNQTEHIETSTRRVPTDPSVAPERLWDPGHCPPHGTRPESHPQSPPGGGVVSDNDASPGQQQQDRSVPRVDPRQGAQAPDCHAYPPGDRPAGLCGWPHDPGPLHPLHPHRAGPAPPRQTPL